MTFKIEWVYSINVPVLTMKNNILWANIPKKGDALAYDCKMKFKFAAHKKISC